MPDPSSSSTFRIITDASCQPQVLSASTKKAVLQERSMAINGLGLGFRAQDLGLLWE